MHLPAFVAILVPGRWRLAAALAGLLATLVPPAAAQDSIDIATLYDEAVAAMSAQKWEEGLTALDEIVMRYGESASTDFGARFGGIYYSKGVCHFELKQYDEAAAAFSTSYEKFPNSADDPANVNPYYKVAAFRWAASEQYAGNFPRALELYNTFLGLKPEAGTYSEAALRLSMAICYAKTGDAAKASDTLGAVIKNARSLGATPVQIMQGVRMLTEAWVQDGPKATAIAHKFFNQYGGAITAPAWDLARTGLDGALLSLGADATSAGMESLAVRIFNYVPKTRDVLVELQQRAVNYPTVPPRLQEEIDKYAAIIESGDPIEVRTLSRMATAYDRLGNYRAGFVIYDLLVANYPSSKFRPEILYGATSMASRIGDYEATHYFGNLFLEDFPEHKYRKDIAALMLGQLFQDGQYETALALAQEVRTPLPAGGPERDLPDFVVGGSLYFLGRYNEAEPELDAHVATYPESPFRENALYYQAANLVKLLKWDQAAEKLDAFIAEYGQRGPEGELPDSELMDLVLLDRANAYFAKDDLGKTQQTIDRLREDYPDSQVLDAALMLQGDIHQFGDKMEQALETYKEAYALSKSLGHTETTANALSQLVGVSVTLGRDDEALQYYDEFQENFAGSYYEPATVVTIMPVLFKRDRVEEGLEKLEQLITSLGADPTGDNLEKAVNTFTEFYSEQKGPEATVERLRAIEESVPGNVPLVAWLTIARIDVLETPANREKFDRREAQIEVAYNQLRDLPRDQLANYIKWKVGNNLISKGDPTQAEPWFASILDGAAPEFKDRATLGLAAVNARSDDPNEQATAVALYKRVLEDYKSSDIAGEALLGLGRLYFEQGTYRKVIDEALQPYMENRGPGYQAARDEVTFKLGRAYEEVGEHDNALFAYSTLIVNHPGKMAFTPEAYVRAAEIQWNRGNKPKAYELVKQMARGYEHLLNDPRASEGHPFIRKALELRDQWATDPAVVAAQAS